MAIGSYMGCVQKNTMKKIILNLFGTLDYHSHIRLKPLLHYVKRNYIGSNILEIGCGSGLVAYELNKIVENMNYIGVDMDSNSIEIAESVKKKLNANNLKFIKDDAINFLQINKENINQINTIVLYDFLEHVKNQTDFLKELFSMFNNSDTNILISVPTHIYPKVFGRKFHNQIGHQVDGFSLEEMENILSKVNCSILNFEYSTGILNGIGANLYYEKLKCNKLLKAIITFPFRIGFDINNHRYSSSLFIVAKKI